MTDLPTHLLVAIQTINVPEGTLEERLKAAMRQTRNGHWMCTSEDECFRAAVGAVVLKATDEEKERIKAELDALEALSALFCGVPVDLERIPIPENPLGLSNMWASLKE